MIQPGRTRQEVIILKAPIWLKLSRKIECHEHVHVLKYQVKIFHFTRVMGNILILVIRIRDVIISIFLL